MGKTKSKKSLPSSSTLATFSRGGSKKKIGSPAPVFVRKSPKGYPPIKKGTVAKKKRLPTVAAAAATTSSTFTKKKQGVTVVEDGRKSPKNSNSNQNKKKKINGTATTEPTLPSFLARSTKNSKKKKTTQAPAFQIQLPAKKSGQGRIPWMIGRCAQEFSSRNSPNDDDDDQSNVQAPSPLKRRHTARLPTDDTDPVLMARFSEELQAFAAYVRCTPIECQARDALLEQMHQVAVRVFGNAPDIRVADLELQVFGSYACRDVCSFRSDVDMALWGVVMPKFSYLRKVSTTASTTTTTTKTTTIAGHAKSKETDPKKKRVQKWKALLEAAEDSNAFSSAEEAEQEEEDCVEVIGVVPAPKQQRTKSDDEDVAPGDVVDLTQNDDEEDDKKGDEPPLFILDYTGDENLSQKEDEEEQQQGDTNDAKPAPSVSTLQTATESESSCDSDEAKRNAPKSDDCASCTSSVQSASDDDTADKLTEHERLALLEAAAPPPEALHDYSGGCDPIQGAAAAVPPPEANRPNEEVVSVHDSSGEEEEEEEEEDSDMDVHFFHSPSASSVTNTASTMDASDFSRKKVVDALQRYFRGLRNSDLSRSIQLISKARVPIIKMESCLGVEIDCSVGGMNGADTSLYALKMSQKYQSFGPVVLALKMIMGQQKLDTPFQGGLGSYKLYVLVSHHIAKHLALGGRDDPGEIFLSFAYRYGDSVGHHHTHTGTRTFIDKDDIVSCSHGGQADLSNVFLINECRNLFGSVWSRLWTVLRKKGQKAASDDTPRVSFLAEVIHTTWLDHNRQMNIRNAEDFLKKQNSCKRSVSAPKSARYDATPMSAARRERDLTEDELVASYRGRPSKKARRSF